MQRPATLIEQYEGKAHAEISRGCGFPKQPHPCDLEPHWDQFNHNVVNSWDCVVNNWEGAFDTSLFGRKERVLHPLNQPYLLPELPHLLDEQFLEQLVPIRVRQFPEDEATIAKANQLVRSLPILRHPLSFEVIGFGPQAVYDLPNGPELLKARRDCVRPQSWSKPFVGVQFVSHCEDQPQVSRQLLAHYPNSAIVADELDYSADIVPAHDLMHGYGFAASLQLQTDYVFSLNSFGGLGIDPLAVVISALDHLEHHEWAMVQVLWQPTRFPWEETVREALHDPYKPDKFLFTDISDKVLNRKFMTPLFAVSVRVMSLRESVFCQLLGWAEQFSAPPQSLVPAEDDADDDFAWSVMARCTYRPGLLLNADELASLVHLPAQSVSADRLQRVASRTRPALETKEQTKEQDGSVVLGMNEHRGKTVTARVPAQLRARHCYVAGASGTGKSTLLMNLILQDIAAGHGVGVLDPHGDLIDAVIQRIPEDRIDDVVLFDPADEDYPFALNILEAKDESERERIVNETIMALERYFPASWGPRLERILNYTINTVLHAIPGATLADVEQMLVDPAFRQRTVDRTTDPRLLQFWNNQFIYLPKNSADPVLNKLSVFLTSRVVRNIICQRESAIDFDSLINDGKILLANLSTGLLTSKVAGTFGSFIVTKIVNAAFRRQRIPKEQRRPWYLYVDEFQAFMNLSVGFDQILAEARKYNLVLAGLANQFIHQIDANVRQAIFGNVGTMIVFRLGVEDATTIAREMGVFTPEEIMSLELGESIVRTGGSKTAHNIKTFPDPPLPDYDPSAAIILNTRQEYATPRNIVEWQLRQASESPEQSNTPAPSTSTPPPPKQSPSKSLRPSNKKEQPTKQSKRKKPPYRPADMWPPGHPNAPKPKPSEPIDPSEDDLVL
jgi:hypothetical protein